MRSAVLLIGFNRPALTRRVFAAIRIARPPRFYLAVDGPRPDRVDEVEHTEAVRMVADTVDWPCETRVLSRRQNLGCREGVASALDWFFACEHEGIILEDDCLPTPEFFRFADEMLERYRDDARIGQIGGSSFVNPPGRDSYYWTKYADIWGWATWRRAWELHDRSMAEWPAWREAGGLSHLSGSSPAFVRLWTYLFDQTYAGRIDTWDYQWMFTCWRLGLLTALPRNTQILNLGFEADATHTAGPVPGYVTLPKALAFPLVHPTQIRPNKMQERRIAQRRYGLGWLNEAAALAECVPIVGRRFSIENRKRAEV